MRVTRIPFDLRTWRYRMGWTQVQAAAALGMSLRGYCSAEYRAEDRAECNKTLALLAQALEKESAHA